VIEYGEEFSVSIRGSETTRSASHLPHACQVFLVGGVDRDFGSSSLNTCLRIVFKRRSHGELKARIAFRV
jgi:hypothetical protein